jgi:hypothetical protein
VSVLKFITKSLDMAAFSIVYHVYILVELTNTNVFATFFSHNNQINFHELNNVVLGLTLENTEFKSSLVDNVSV